MKFLSFATIAITILASSASFADDSFKVGHFKDPEKEVLSCKGAKLVQGKGAVLENSEKIDVSTPGPYGPNTSDIGSKTLLETDGVKLVFQTYESDITLFVVPSGVDPARSDNWLAQAGTSLGPIRDSRDEKLFFTYKLPNAGGELMGSCEYSQYVEASGGSAPRFPHVPAGSDSASSNGQPQDDQAEPATAFSAL